MPDQSKQNLSPALRELESALGHLAPAASGPTGTAQRDELMFALGRTAGRKRTRQVQVGTALVALMLGVVVTLPWRWGASRTSPGHETGTLVNKDENTADPDDKMMPAKREQVAVDDSPNFNEVDPGKLLALFGADKATSKENDQRYVSIRDRVLEHGVDALPEVRTGVAGGAASTLMNRLGRDAGSF